MKYYIEHKTGYTYSKNIGCTGEQFILVMIDGKRTNTIAFDGMYGVEDRVRKELDDNDYLGIFTPSFYRKMKRKDTYYKYVLDESKAIKAVHEFVNNIRGENE